MTWLVEFTDEERNELQLLLAARIAQAPRLIIEDLINADAYRERTRVFKSAQEALSEATLQVEETVLDYRTARTAWDKLEEIGRRHGSASTADSQRNAESRDSDC